MKLTMRIVGDIDIKTHEQFEYLRDELENINLTDNEYVIRVDVEELKNFLIIRVNQPNLKDRGLLMELYDTVKNLTGIEQIYLLI